MKRRSFVKNLLAASIAGAFPVLAVSNVPYTHASNVVIVHIPDDLPAPVDGVIHLAPNTTYRLMRPLSLTSSIHAPANSLITSNLATPPITIVGK